MAEIVKEESFDKSEYYDEEGNVIYCEDTEILIQGEPGGRGEPEVREDGTTRTPITIGVYSGNLWSYKVMEWPWAHETMMAGEAPRWGVKEEPADYFAHKYNFYCGVSWVYRMPPEVAMFLLSRPYRLIPNINGSVGLHAAIKIHEDPEKGKELKAEMDKACESYREYIESSSKLGVHGYDSGTRRPRTMLFDAAVRMREKLANINTHFNRIKWLEYNIRFKNDMEEWKEIFSEEHHQEWVALTAEAFEEIGLLLDQEKLVNEEEDN